MIPQPLFLVGAERSGTTLLRLMLDHHPQLAFQQEFELAVDHIGPHGEWPKLDHYYRCLSINRQANQYGLHIDRSLDYPTLVDSFLQQKRHADGKPLIGATVHRRFDLVLKIWPDARFIHLIRDGRDVARSCIQMGWAGNLWRGIERWIEAEDLWDRLAASLPSDRRIEVRYEELIAEPREQLTRICAFIGISFSEAMFDYADTTTYELPDPKFTQQWRTKLSNHEIRLVESRISDHLTRRGYELSGLPPLVVGPIRRQWYDLQNWAYRVRFRIERFGFWLTLGEWLARKLRLWPFQKRMQLRINAIAQRHIK